MRVPELAARPLVLVPVAVALQWLTTAVVAWRADGLSIGAAEAFQVLLLGPLAVAAAYVVAAAVSGAALAAWTLLVWVMVPWLAHPFTLASYDATMRDVVLPLVLGLEGNAGYAEGVALLAALALALVATRWSRGLAAAVVAGLAAVWVLRATPFPELSLDVLQAHSAGLREFFWSQRLLQWLPLAGAVAVARRAPLVAVALLGWFLAYLVLRASQPGTGFDSGGFFRGLLPALPAYVLLAAALPLLIPTLARRLATPAARPRDVLVPPGAPAAAPGSSSGPTGAR